MNQPDNPLLALGLHMQEGAPFLGEFLELGYSIEGHRTGQTNPPLLDLNTRLWYE